MTERTPDWQRDGVELFLGDCLDWMRDQKTDAVDLVFGSPPYEDARTYDMDFRLKGQDWVDWLMPRIIEAVRICRGLVAVIVEGRQRQFRWSATPALLMADLHRAGVHLRKPPAFHRVGIPGGGGPDWLRNDYEFIVCATSGGKLPWSDNTAMGHPPKWAPGGEMSHRLTDGTRKNQWGGTSSSTGMRRECGKRRKHFQPSHRPHTKRRADGEMEVQSYGPPVKANPGNLIQVNTGGGHMGSKLAHENEAPFPETLPEFFIRSFCPSEGIVLDPFAGSGTTLAVAKQWGRRSIGIDVRESQVELCRKRMAEVRDRYPLFEATQ